MNFEIFLIGLIIAVFYVELFDIYPGGIIVPAYIALYLDQPLKVLATIAVAFLSLYTYKGLSRFLILFGKRRFVMMILLGALWSELWYFVLPHFFPSFFPLGLRAIGWVIPGLLANNLEKQKIIPTLASMFTVSVITYFLGRMLL